MERRLVSDAVAGEILSLADEVDWQFDSFGDDGSERLTFTIHGQLRSDKLGLMASKLDRLKQKLLARESADPIPQ